MSLPGFDLSQFYTRRNSNYNVTPESSNNAKPTNDVAEVDDSEDCGATRILCESDNSVAPSTPYENKEVARNICGFLFSISRDEEGEYWPVRLGSNSIGNSSDCDITLSQNSVKTAHATLVAERNEGKLTIKISGEGSVLVNGLELTEETTCRDRDILTIGKAYQLLLLVADKEKYGLTKADNFDEAEEQPAPQPMEEEEAAPAEEEGTVFLQ